MYYAIEHRYGANVGDEHGDHIGQVHAFASRVERDAWIAGGNPYVNDQGSRSALSTRGSWADRRALRAHRAAQ